MWANLSPLTPADKRFCCYGSINRRVIIEFGIDSLS